MSEIQIPATNELIKTITFPFTDKRWFLKVLIGILLGIAACLIPVIPSIFLLGYYYRISRRIIAEDGQAAVPEWEDWGRLFTDGIRYFGAALIYSLPMLIAFILMYAVMFLPMLGMMDMGSSMQPWGGYGDATRTLGSFGLIFLMYPMMAFNMLVFLLTVVFLPPALMHVVAKDSFGAAFQFSGWWKIFRANFGGFVIAFMISTALLCMIYFGSFILLSSIVFCIVAPIFLWLSAMLVGLVISALYARAYRAGVETLAGPKSTKNPPDVVRQVKPQKASPLVPKQSTRVNS